jgi:hypothetical protein
MWKWILAAVVAIAAVFWLLSKGGDIDMSGDHGGGAVKHEEPAKSTPEAKK